MKKIITLLFIFPVLIIFLNAGSSWKKVLEKDNITVFTREVSGSEFNEFRGETIIDEKIEVVMEVFRDFPNMKNWLGDCIESKLLEKIGENNYLVYSVTDAPWPVLDRDAVINRKDNIDYKNGKIIITMTAVEYNKIPHKKDLIRIQELKGTWTITYLERNKTKVEYKVKSNPGGRISSNLANSTSKNIPYKTLIGLRKVTKNNKYKEAALKSKDRLEIEKYIKEGFLK